MGSTAAAPVYGGVVFMVKGGYGYGCGKKDSTVHETAQYTNAQYTTAQYTMP
jgi:hypothetical protein